MCVWMMAQCALLSLPQHFHSSFLQHGHRACFHCSPAISSFASTLCLFTFLSIGNMVLNMYQGYLGHVIHVTLATCSEYIACTVCSHIHEPGSTRVFGCTCSFCFAYIRLDILKVAQMCGTYSMFSHLVVFLNCLKIYHLEWGHSLEVVSVCCGWRAGQGAGECFIKTSSHFCGTREESHWSVSAHWTLLLLVLNE